jgi:hypothetical protein
MVVVVVVGHDRSVRIADRSGQPELLTGSGARDPQGRARRERFERESEPDMGISGTALPRAQS